MINISSDIVGQLNSSVNVAFTGFIPVFAVLLSIILSFYVLRKIIFLLTLAKR